MEYENNKYGNALPGYLENPVTKPKLFYHTDLRTNLEGITLEQTPEKKLSPLEKIFSDKTKTHKAGVKALLKEIELREYLDSHILKNIDKDMSNQNLYLEHLNTIKVQYSFDLAKSINKTKSQIENNLLELGKEKRKEYLECWRDLMLLKKYLLSSLKDYWSLVKKREVLEG